MPERLQKINYWKAASSTGGRDRMLAAAWTSRIKRMNACLNQGARDVIKLLSPTESSRGYAKPAPILQRLKRPRDFRQLQNRAAIRQSRILQQELVLNFTHDQNRQIVNWIVKYPYIDCHEISDKCVLLFPRKLVSSKLYSDLVNIGNTLLFITVCIKL